ncbi:hypothetical protein RvY_18923-1 [Ramazzottius varieornatus]|uniref:EF-hand domain-containing protein n=1 Tax=Ramazzottius varieornatus TaxID=947166 RepID=A0A1D1W7K2_RAMVA|nr:hypothetical protein RvY_18923-1 [Ramazzottius varieornatus]
MGNSSSKKSHVSKGDKLSKSDLDFLRANTNFDETTIREWHTGFHRDCPNGKLSPEKFVEVYKVFFPSGNASLFCEHVFRTFDQDKSGEARPLLIPLPPSLSSLLRTSKYQLLRNSCVFCRLY